MAPFSNLMSVLSFQVFMLTDGAFLLDRDFRNVRFLHDGFRWSPNLKFESGTEQRIKCESNEDLRIVAA
jgi:hypothetical protein